MNQKSGVKSLTIVFICLLTIFTFCLPAGSISAQEESKGILILNSYHKGLYWSDGEMQGIEAALPKNVNVSVEYMDTKRLADDEYLNLLYETYKLKYQHTEFDCLISLDNNAFNFMLKYRDSLFPGPPLVFGGVNHFQDAMIAGHDLVTGVAETIDYEGTIEFALKLHPHTKQVLVLTDHTTTGQTNRQYLEKLAREDRFPVELVFLDKGDGLDLPELLTIVSNVPSDSIVYYSDFFRDKHGNLINHEEFLPILSSASTAPIYNTGDFYLGHGTVGGKLVSGFYEGDAVGQMVARILKGEPVSEIPVQREGISKYMFDYEQLKRWDIPLSALPEDSIIFNAPPTSVSTSFYEQYKEIIWGTGFFIVGQMIAIVALWISIIRRERAQKEIRILNEELEQRVIERTAQLEATNKELEAFAYSVSHDLRAPLRSVNGFSQVLLEDYAQVLDEPGKDYLYRVCAASQRMGQLIDDLLQLSRVTRGELRHTLVNLSDLVREIATEFQQTQPTRQVEFFIASGLIVNGDSHLLQVVLENLLDNAWKFTRNQAHATIEFGGTEINGDTAYFVRDNGVGFDMTYADKLFGAFQRLHRMTEFEGTGIGLATVQRIIHRHGGQVWAKAEVDKGATFYFTL
jgi:signal transduction histidine kinase